MAISKVGNTSQRDLMRKIVRTNASSAICFHRVSSLKYGEGTAEELEYLSRTTLKISRVEYEEKISYYKNHVENLKEEKGIA